MSQDNKQFYGSYRDDITAKRVRSPYPIRRGVHEDMYQSVLRHILPGTQVLDAGCGDGELSCRMAQRGVQVTAVDLSVPNVEAARQKARDLGIPEDRVEFHVGDCEYLPFEDESFNYVVSHHVLEHLPDFDRGLAEIYRITRKKAFIAVPTCLSLASWALLGGDRYWRVGKRTLFALPFGLLRTVLALVTCAEGVNETYAGNSEAVHIFRFPWVVEKKIRTAGFEILSVMPQTLRLPYVKLSPPARWGETWLRFCGIGTLYVATKGPDRTSGRPHNAE